MINECMDFYYSGCRDSRIQTLEDVVHALEQSGSYNAEDMIKIVKMMLKEEIGE